MAPNNEAKIAELLRKVVSDPNAAAELLALAADYLKDREPMPDALADYLARAFRRAASTPQPDDDRSSGEGKSIEDERIARLIEGLCMRRETGAPHPRSIGGGGCLHPDPRAAWAAGRAFEACQVQEISACMELSKAENFKQAIAL